MNKVTGIQLLLQFQAEFPEDYIRMPWTAYNSKMIKNKLFQQVLRGLLNTPLRIPDIYNSIKVLGNYVLIQFTILPEDGIQE